MAYSFDDDADQDAWLCEPDVPPDIPREAPLTPTEAEWAAMSEAERQRAVTELEDSWTWEEEAERMAMAEGDPHLDAKMEIRDSLRGYFSSIRRRIYIGAEIKTYYPGIKGFTPDIIAVVDADPRQRSSWMVLQEGKGLSLAMEVYFSGRRKKDFVTNVEKFAKLGIPEYFIFDRKRLQLLGYRLPAEGARVYQPLEAQDGRLRSEVLGLDLILQDGHLRFYQGTALVLTDREQVEQERRRATQAEQERQQAEQERQQAEQERQQAEQERQQAVVQLCQSQARAILTILRVRGVPIPDAARTQLEGCADPMLLERWLTRAATAPTFEALFLDG